MNKLFLILILLFGKSLSIAHQRSCVTKRLGSLITYRLSQPPLQVRAARPQVFSARSSLHPFAFLAATQLEYFSSQRCLQAVRRLVEVTLRLSCAASKACDCGAENDAPALTMSSREKNIPSVFRLLIISVSLQVG
jgi:hypothetical protein